MQTRSDGISNEWFPTAPGSLVALIGGLWGVIGAVALASLRAVLGASSGDPLPYALPGDVAFGAIYILPFALSLAALKWGGPVNRAATWAWLGARRLPAFRLAP